MVIGHQRGLAGRARDGERGAVLVLVAVCATVLVTAVAFTVDLGRVSLLRRDLQKTADVVALDLARRLDGRTTAEIVADPTFETVFRASLKRNGFIDGASNDATWRIGRWDPRTDTFTPTIATEVPEAVEVVVGDRVDYEFAPGGADTSRRGVASSRPIAAFQLGSYAARLDSSTSPILDALLGDMVGATAVGYRGLVGGRVAIGELLDELDLDIGTPDDVMATSVTLAELLAAQAVVLRNHGDLARAAIVEQALVNLPNPNATIPLARLMTLGVGTDAGAASVGIDAFDLLVGSAFVANGTNFLDVPALALSVGGLAVTRAQVQVIAGPVTVIGGVGASGSTAQVTVRLEVAGSVPGLTDLTLLLELTSASATATITNLRCGTPQHLDLAVQTGLLTVAAPITARVYTAVPLLGTVPVADVALNAAISRPGGTLAMPLTFPPDRFFVPVQAPSAGLNLGTATVTIQRVTALGLLPVGPALNAAVSAVVGGVVTPVLNQLDATLLTPLLRALGTTVAGADVTPLALTCNGTKLVG